jgi:hypothetical protein
MFLVAMLLAWCPAPAVATAWSAPYAAADPNAEAAAEMSDADALLQVPDDEAIARGSDTPRNAAFTFIVLARDGDWHDASDMIERPAAGWPEGVSAERIARALGLWWVSALPEFLVNIRIAEIELWQWIGLAAIGGAGLLVGWASRGCCATACSAFSARPCSHWPRCSRR